MSSSGSGVQLSGFSASHSAARAAIVKSSCLRRRLFGAKVATVLVLNQSWIAAFATSVCQLLVVVVGYAQILQRMTLKASARVIVSRGLNFVLLPVIRPAICDFSATSQTQDGTPFTVSVYLF